MNYGQPRSGGSKRWLIVLLLIFALGYLGYRKFVGFNLEKANSALEAGAEQEAEASFRLVNGLPFANGFGEDGLGVLALLRGENERAKTFFSSVLAHKPSRVAADPGLVLQIFMKRSRYEAGAAYLEMLQAWRGAAYLKDYAAESGLIALGNHDLVAAKAFADQIKALEMKSDAALQLKELIDVCERTGALPVVLDRNRLSLVQYNFQSKALEFAVPQLFPFWADPNGKPTLLDQIPEVDRQNRVLTTLDLNLQKAASQAMLDFEGTIVLMQPGSGEVLALYATPGLDPYTTFEPGSVIKVLTYGNYLKHNGDLHKYAPRHYPGTIEIDGKAFHDWTVQGSLASIEEGMAVSCNIMFGQMGMDLGWPELRKGYDVLLRAPSNSAGMLGPVTFGRLLSEPVNTYEIARIAIGLEFLEINTMGLVRIPAAIADNGSLPEPRLVSAYENLLSQTSEIPAANPLPFFESKDLAALAHSMRAALTSPRGTARRAEVDFVKSAMKTGTAGDRPFDAILFGFFPLEKPKIAFAFYLRNGGKCEINGAKVARKLLEQIKAQGPQYLVNP